MRTSFHIPQRFHPGYSLLGRWLLRQTGDRRRAEAYLILALTGLGLAFVLAHYLVWTLVEVPSKNLTNTTALLLWGAELSILLLLGMTCVWGYQPAVTVTCTSDGLRLRQGDRLLTLSHEEITTIEAIPPLRFHRHERRYAATHVFVNQIEGELLLLKTTRGPVVLGLAPEGQAAFAQACSDAKRTESTGARYPVEREW